MPVFNGVSSFEDVLVSDLFFFLLYQVHSELFVSVGICICICSHSDLHWRASTRLW